MSHALFAPGFKARPWWWEAAEPPQHDAPLPDRVGVAVVGGGYAGLACALELHKHGLDAVVLDAEMPGFGASSRNGGMVSGGVTVGKRYSGKDPAGAASGVLRRRRRQLHPHRETHRRGKDRLRRKKTGRFAGAWCRKHYRALEKKFELINEGAGAGAYLLPRARQREEIGSDFYHGGMVVMRSAHLHPALYFKGPAGARRGRGIPVCAKAPVIRIARHGPAWRVETARGTVETGDVVVCTNGYTRP